MLAGAGEEASRVEVVLTSGFPTPNRNCRTDDLFIPFRESPTKTAS